MIEWTEPDYLNLDWSGHDLPQPHVEISRDEFLTILAATGGVLQGTNYRQIRMTDDPGKEWHGSLKKTVWDCHFYFYGETAIAVAATYINDGTGIEEDEGWKTSDGRVLHGQVVKRSTSDGFLARFYRLGCTHEATTEEKISRRERRVTCPDCGMSYTYDSSG